jgi:drug/metabolite transporter (DMT)-like permease
MFKDQALATLGILICTFIFAADNADSQWWGFLLCAVGFMAYAVSDVSQKKIANSIDWSTALLWRQGSQALLYSLLVIGFFYWQEKTPFLMIVNYGWALFGWIVGISLIVGVIGKALHYQAVKHLPLSRYTLVEQLKPLLVFVDGIVLLNEQASTSQLLSGSVMILLMFWVVWRDQQKAT